MKIGDIATMKDIPVSEFLGLDEQVKEDYDIHFGEIGVINWVDEDLARIGYVREAVELPTYLIEVLPE